MELKNLIKGITIASLVAVSTACSGGGDASSPETTSPEWMSWPSTTVAVTTTSLVATPGDLATCIQFLDAIGDFASTGSRQWVDVNGSGITVSGLDWWIAQGDLNEVVTPLLTVPNDPDLISLLVEVSNAMQDDLNAEFDDPNQNAFPLAVYDAVKALDVVSRRFEDRCHVLGSAVDAFHPLDAVGDGGSADT